MSQLPIATVDDKEADDEFALVLAECGVIQEHSSTLMSANQPSNKCGDERPRLSFFSEASQQPSADSVVPTRANKAEPAKRKRSVRRAFTKVAIGVTTSLLAGWFAWCGIAAWQNDSQASSLTPAASNQVSYQTTNIEDLVAGDTVIAMNPETGEVGAKKVLQTFERVADHLQIVTFEYGDGSSQVIETTDEHPFWLRFEKKWTRAADLKQGDTVTGPNDEMQTVAENFREEHPDGIVVYNFEVEDWHTYFVFANGSRAPPVLVHNASPEYQQGWQQAYGTNKGANNSTVRSRAKIGQEAHRQLEADGAAQWHREQTIRLPNGQVVRKDGVSIVNARKVRIIKPDTPSGRRAAQNRKELMEKFGFETEIDLYNPADPRWQPDSPTYIGPSNH